MVADDGRTHAMRLSASAMRLPFIMRTVPHRSIPRLRIRSARNELRNAPRKYAANSHSLNISSSSRRTMHASVYTAGIFIGEERTQ
ncbi:hypothetical protein HMPREF0762_02067 [Slackia exigua ATCC 700122]|uniref:Uncharacterized protein n=1 Tax=Slackia exigua (strain ATCC 700122 / DSM 15923 / CIP 105133 / JCM 11022 / KCTC 5966 / S-7) TaxID=649764 RepID=D0WJP0_SLAES|nr:hypothetical protein HMPREF0762_02067 [Slackia exigua ATCC 700122]